MEITFGNAQVAILFAILFIVVGYTAPVAYAAYAPTDHYIKVDEFSAQDTTTADSSHLLCFDRNVKEPNSGTVFTELYLVNGDSDSRVEVDSRTMERYFQDGDRVVETRMPLPKNLEAGEYRYILVIQMDLAQGRVQREFEYTSEKFTVVEGESAQTTNSTTEKFTC